MNLASNSFNLIIINDSPKEAQRLASMLDNAGRHCQALHISTENKLNKALDEQNWHIVIADNQCESLSAATVIRNIRKTEKNIPVVLITDTIDSKTIIDGMKLGASDVCLLDDDQHLLLILSRELENQEQRRQVQSLKHQLNEMAKRNKSLLDSSRDGISYIQDGTFLYSNDSLAEMLGYDTRDDIEFMPVMDFVKADEQELVKQKLKQFSDSHSEGGIESLKFTALLADESTKLMNAELFMGEHDGERCVQMICYAKLENQEQIEAEIQAIKYTDAATGLYNRDYLIEGIDQAVKSARSGKQSQGFIYIDIDRYSKRVKKSVNLTDTDILLKAIGDYITKNYIKATTIARISDHAYGIITTENDIERILERSQKLCKKIEDHLFEIGQKTVQVTLSIGVCLIDKNIPDYHTVINQSVQAVDVLRKNQDGNGANIYQEKSQHGTVLATTLTQAIDKNQFKLLFQPILSLRGEDTERYEVLLRMMQDDQMIAPVEFIGIASQLKLATKLDRWVILESIKHMQKNIRNKKETQQFINLTIDSVLDDTLLPWMKVALDAASIQPKNIVLQAHMEDIVNHLAATVRFVEHAKEMGIAFCITHYGRTENSSAIFEHLNVSHIKLDGALSQALQNNPDDENMENIINFLHDEHKTTIMPMVEKASVLSKLWQLGVHCIQGHYLQPPSMDMDFEFNAEN